MRTEQTKQYGFILIPVVILLSILAVVTLMIGVETSQEIRESVDKLDVYQIDYVTQTGLNHGLWEVAKSYCGPFNDITNQAFGDHSYSATITPNNAGGSITIYTVSVSDDAWIKKDTPTQNYGSNTVLSTYSDLSQTSIQRALYRFDIAGSGIPAGATVVSAIAKLYVTDSNTAPVNIHQVTSDWTEAAVHWDNINSLHESASLGSIPGSIPADAFFDVNISALAQGWINGDISNQGIMLKTTAILDTASFTSKEYSNSSQRPVLEVTVVTGDLSNRAGIKAVGSLDSGISRSLTRTDIILRQPPSTLVWQPGDELQDAFVWDGTHKYKNFGTSPILNIKNDRNVLVQFAIEALPPGARIIDAKLSLYLEGGSGVNNGVLDLHAISRSWEEGDFDDVDPSSGVPGVTYEEPVDDSTSWTTRGGDYHPEIIDSITLPSMAVGWYEWTVTEQINKWLDGAPNYGFLLREGGGDAGDIDFVSSDNTSTPQYHPKLTVTLACECGVVCLIPQGSGKVLMVARDDVNITAEDVIKRSILESWGYTVTLIDDNDNQATFNSAFANNDVIYVSDTSDSNTVGTKLSNATIGLVNEEGSLNDELGISTSKASYVVKNITIEDTSHPITQIFSASSIPIYALDMEGLTATGTLATDGQTLGKINSEPGLFAIDPGGILADGSSTAPTGMVLLPVGTSQKNFNWDYLNNNGRLIVQRSIEWAKDNPGASCSGISGSFSDVFFYNSFSNDDGDLSWSDDWIEEDTSGNGPTNGKVRVRFGELRMKGRPSGDSPSLARELDLSEHLTATLTFDYRTGSGVDAGKDNAVVEVSDDGGSTWTELESFLNVGPSATGSSSHDISTYIASNTQVRFRINIKYRGPNEYFYVDNVTINATCP